MKTLLDLDLLPRQVFRPYRGQGRCAICGEPFIYWPTRQAVEQREDGMYIHSECKGK